MAIGTLARRTGVRVVTPACMAAPLRRCRRGEGPVAGAAGGKGPMHLQRRQPTLPHGADGVAAAILALPYSRLWVTAGPDTGRVTTIPVWGPSLNDARAAARRVAPPEES